MKLTYWLLPIILIASIVFVSGCIRELPTGHAVKGPEVVYETGPAIQTYFCIKDNCEQKLVALIENSTNVDCAIYNMDLSSVKSALKEKNYRLVVDVGEKDKFAGLEYVTQGGDGLMHNKFCIFDNQTVFTGSFNPTQKQNTVDDNNIVIIDSKYLAENYEDEFNELYYRQVSGPPTKYPKIIYNGELIENYFCPEDHCADHLIEALNSSNSEIKFMTFSFTYAAIGDLLLAKNVPVQGIFDKQQAGSNYSQFHKLNGTLDVRLDGGKGLLHHKVFIIDRKIVATGSFNPTKSGDTKNDENLLIIHSPEIAEKYLAEFENLWNESS